MSDVFISYKREDEARVARLAKALESAGFDVWWDRGLPGGESWRANIEAALESARCVVAVWSKASVAKEGHFVRDEAGRAMARGQLVPVFIDRVDLPLGFGEVQAIDLSHWKGNPNDPFFRDLVAAIRAKLDGVPCPKAIGPTARLMRRLTFGSASSLTVAVVASIAFNAFGISTKVCTAVAMQPALSDGCGALGLGGRPSRTERLSWEARRPGSCPDLRAYIDRYHDGGAYLTEANALLAARRVTQERNDTPGTRYLALYVGKDGPAASDEATARAAALARAQADAERLCQGFAATTLFKLTTAKAAAQNWSCAKSDSGVVCGFDGQAVCALQESTTVEHETCGSAR
jgi:hypothetical protein